MGGFVGSAAARLHGGKESYAGVVCLATGEGELPAGAACTGVAGVAGVAGPVPGTATAGPGESGRAAGAVCGPQPKTVARRMFTAIRFSRRSQLRPRGGVR